MINLRPKIALYQPDIPQNTAAIIRTCSCLGADLEIIEPCGFLFTDKRFKRVVMDYMDKEIIKFYQNSDEFFKSKKNQRVILMTTKSSKSYINFKFKRHEERIIMLDKQKSALMRPNLLVASDTGAPYQKAFGAYLRRGDEAGLCAMDLDSKGMSSSVNGDGGCLVDPQIALAVQSVLREANFIRKISNVVNV